MTTELETKLYTAFRDALDRDITYSSRSLHILDELIKVNKLLATAIQQCIPSTEEVYKELIALGTSHDALWDDIQECYSQKRDNWTDTMTILDKMRAFNTEGIE